MRSEAMKSQRRGMHTGKCRKVPVLVRVVFIVAPSAFPAPLSMPSVPGVGIPSCECAEDPAALPTDCRA